MMPKLQLNINTEDHINSKRFPGHFNPNHEIILPLATTLAILAEGCSATQQVSPQGTFFITWLLKLKNGTIRGF